MSCPRNDRRTARKIAETIRSSIRLNYPGHLSAVREHASLTPLRPPYTLQLSILLSRRNESFPVPTVHGSSTVTLTKDDEDRVSQVRAFVRGSSTSEERNAPAGRYVCEGGSVGDRRLSRTSDEGDGGGNKKPEDADTNRLQKHNNRERERV